MKIAKHFDTVIVREYWDCRCVIYFFHKKTKKSPLFLPKP